MLESLSSKAYADVGGITLIDPDIEKKQGWLPTLQDQSMLSNNIAYTDILWDRIVSIEYFGREQVYDIEVEGMHNFIGNGIFAHNTYISDSLGIGVSAPSEKLELASGGNLKLTAGNITIARLTNATTVPTLGQTAGGVIAATTYYAKYTWVNANGETTASTEASLAVLVNNVLTVTVPAFPTRVTAANVYASTSTGTETKQAQITTSAGTWTEPTTGLVAGTALPSANSTGGDLTIQGDLTLPALSIPETGTITFGGD
ncbi:hypothetical protein KKC04_04970, partial [Patescibacteria group bacterium]|nr:hypothetical protein [Patescibacteria group bacterium]